MQPTPPGQEPSAEYVRVALDLPIEPAYQYVVPPALRKEVSLGSIVRAPVQSRQAHGCVLGFEERPATRVVKPLEAVLSPPFTLTEELIGLGRWMADYYMAPLGETLRTVSFIGFADVHAPTEQLLCLAKPDYWLRHPGENGPDGKRVTPHQRRVVESLVARSNEPTAPTLLRIDAEVSDSVLGGMRKRGLLERIASVLTVEDEYGSPPPQLDQPLALSTAQAAALAPIVTALREKTFKAFLLYGVTGSGKTEVYLQAIAEALRQGRQAVVLTPEIALTPQTVDRFRARFGEAVGVYHSRLTLRQKFSLWRQIHKGEVKIVVGARSALFAPFPALGVVVVDEEHSSSYKQDASPRYHARDVAVVRARLLGAAVILGSATPSLESYANAQSGKYKLLELPERVGRTPMPKIDLLDMSRELRKTHGNPGIFSDRLREAVALRLEAGEQVLLLVNRRGYASVSICLECETVERCEDCDASMTYHRSHDQLLCHLCNRRRSRAEVCPSCGAKEMALVGLGTQKVEESLAALFPKARVIRLDSDTTRGRLAWNDRWREIRQGAYDLILGTQMIAKGLHLEKVTLVGVVSADGALFQPDFRAAERTFSLLSQAAGRSGRGEKPGEVVIQSYSPAHYAVRLAREQDFPAFYEQEMRLRRALRFPPIERLISLLVTGEQVEAASSLANRLAGLLRYRARDAQYEGLSVLGPAPCPIERIRGRWRRRILVRGPSPGPMHDLVRAALETFKDVKGRSRVAVQIDVDPQELL
jgi:primosomal protein N' (replication factor Y)